MKIGWIGAGIMGSPMIVHLIDHQYEVHVYARHAEKIKPVLDKGAILEKEIESVITEEWIMESIFFEKKEPN